MAGYSGTPLLPKLGYKPGQTIYLKDAPMWFSKLLRAEGIQPGPLPTDWAHGFFAKRSDLEKFLKKLNLDKVSTGLWVSWPKKASKMPTDLTEQTFRDLILPLGWVDIKVAAIDETWSGLKFTRRKLSIW